MAHLPASEVSLSLLYKALNLNALSEFSARIYQQRQRSQGSLTHEQITKVPKATNNWPN
jgi:hypothetical protein